MQNRFHKLFLVPFILLLLIATILSGLFLIIHHLLNDFQVKTVLIYIFSVILAISLVGLLFTGYYFYLKDKQNSKELFLKRTNEFDRFFNLFYEYCIDKVLGQDILKNLQYEFAKLSIYVSDKTIALFNQFFQQSDNYEKDNSLTKQEQKVKRISFEECLMALREELGISKRKATSVALVNNTNKTFRKMEILWTEWSKNRIWHFETCLDFGISAFDLMKKHNLVFTGGGPKSINASIVKSIKKGDIILAHKFGEGYLAIGMVTVDTKTIVWPKDNPLMYTDGEIRIPVRWLMLLNVGVDAGYLPSGNISRILNPEKSIVIIEAMVKRASEAGNEYSQNELAGLLKNIKSLKKLEKPELLA